MERRQQPPSWEEIRDLIAHVDEVCRESEYLRAHAERVMRRPTVWPDQRHEPRTHSEPGNSVPLEDDATPQGH